MFKRKKTKGFVVMLVVFMMVSAVLVQSVSAFSVQGIVTGRMYDELAVSNNPVFQEYYDMKLGWVRIEFEEFYGVPAGSNFNSPGVQANKVKFQNVINNAHAKGLKVLGVIANSAIPDSITGFPDTDVGIQSYKSAVLWHLQNYNVDAVEIWNEPGVNVKFTNENLNRYAKTLIECYSLKTSYPNVLFVGPGTSNAEKNVWIGNDSSRWEKSIFNCTDMINYRNTHSNKLPLDVVSWHAYGSGGAPDSINFYFGRNFSQYYNEIKGWNDRTGRNVIGNYPIWFTEYGWDSNAIGIENQRIYTEKMVKEIFSKPQIEVPFLYTYRDDGSSAGSEGNYRGIRTSLDSGSAKKRVYWPFVAHNCLVGLFTNDGVNEWTIDEIINEYYDNGGRSSFGDAWKHPDAPWYGDKAHYWGPNNNGYIQQFNYGTNGECGILMKAGSGRAYTLKGAFYRYYTQNSGPYNSGLGWLIGNQYTSGGYTWQNCEYGKMRMDSSGNVTRVP